MFRLRHSRDYFKAGKTPFIRERSWHRKFIFIIFLAKSVGRSEHSSCVIYAPKILPGIVLKVWCLWCNQPETQIFSALAITGIHLYDLQEYAQSVWNIQVQCQKNFAFLKTASELRWDLRIIWNGTIERYRRRKAVIWWHLCLYFACQD